MNTRSLKIRANTVLILVLISIAGIGPIPLTSTLGVFLVIFRPCWFKRLVEDIYADG